MDCISGRIEVNWRVRMNDRRWIKSWGRWYLETRQEDVRKDSNRSTWQNLHRRRRTEFFRASMRKSAEKTLEWAASGFDDKMDVGDVGKNNAGRWSVNFHRIRWKEQLRDSIEEIGIGDFGRNSVRIWRGNQQRIWGYLIWWTGDDVCFSFGGSMMGGEEWNWCRRTKNAEETVLWCFSLVGE